MTLRSGVSCLVEEVLAFGWLDGWEQVDDGVVECVLSALCGGPQAVFELGEEHLDKVQIRRKRPASALG